MQTYPVSRELQGPALRHRTECSFPFFPLALHLGGHKNNDVREKVRQVIVCLQVQIVSRGLGLLAFGNGFIQQGVADQVLGLEKAKRSSGPKPQGPCVRNSCGGCARGRQGSSHLWLVRSDWGAWKVLEQRVM